MSKRKILFFEPFSGVCAGAQKVFINVLDCLNEHHDVQLIKRNASSEYDSMLSKFYISGYFPFEGWLSNLFGTGSFFKNISIPKVFKFIFLIISCNFSALISVLKHKPDYVYTYEPRGLLLSCLLLRLTKTKVIWHLHSDLPSNRIFEILVNFLVDKVIVPSNSIKDSNDKIYNIKVIYNGFTFPEVNVINKREREVVFLGTHHPHKGLHNLLEACVIMEINNPEISFTLNVYGQFEKSSAEYSDILNRHMEKLKRNKVKFHGWTSNPIDKIVGSNMLVFPSVISQELLLGNELHKVKSSEALPTVIIESLSVGVPVVATRTPGADEILCSKNDGFLIDESNPQLISKAMAKILLNPSKFITNSETTREKFSLVTMNHELLKLFK